MKPATGQAQAEAHYRALMDQQLTLQLATCNKAGEAEISYAAYLHQDGCFYIYVSALAAHTGNMLRNHQAGVMFIQPESAADNVFARQRLIFNCKVREVNNNEGLYNAVLDAMQNRFGGIIDVLRSLSDFHLLALTPGSGQYVAGFGQAYQVDVVSGQLHPLVIDKAKP